MIPVAGAGGSDDGSGDSVRDAQALLLCLGREGFGPPLPEVEQRIREIADLPRLKALCTRLLQTASWQELLSEEN
jgi:hypothetical protein